MTYIDLINRYWRMDLEFNFSHLENHLFFQLLHIGNQSGWRKAVSVTNKRLCAAIGTDNKALIKARQRLNDVDLIFYEKGTTRKAGTYILDPDYFPENMEKETNKATNKQPTENNKLLQNSGKSTNMTTNLTTNLTTNVTTNQNRNTTNNTLFGESKNRQEKNRQDNHSIERANAYQFFRENFDNPNKLIARLRHKNALGEYFDDFLEYVLFEKKAGDLIKNSGNPVGYIISIRKSQWSYFQQWRSERNKREESYAAAALCR